MHKTEGVSPGERGGLKPRVCPSIDIIFLKNYNLKNIKMLFSGNNKMKNIDVLHHINILRIYVKSFEIKCFYLDLKTNFHFSFCQTSTSHREMQMSI